MTAPGMRELRCCIHLHTYASDGCGSIADICAAATREGIDCVIITDHETLGHGMNGYAGKVLVLTGEEITPGYTERLDAAGTFIGSSVDNHLLALGIHQAIHGRDLSLQQSIDAIIAQGGLAFLCHPSEPGHPWTDWSVDHFAGIELWTFKAAWKRGAMTSPTKAFACCNPDAVLAGPTTEELARWDQLGRSRRIVAIGCSDNHAMRSLVDGVERTIFPWSVGVSTILSHIWVKPQELEADPLSAVLGAIASGRVIVAHDGLSPATGFVVTASDTKGCIAWPGEQITLARGLEIKVSSPKVATLRVLRDGMIVQDLLGTACNTHVDVPGVWRVEAHLGDRPWVFANPFYIDLPSGCATVTLTL